MPRSLKTFLSRSVATLAATVALLVPLSARAQGTGRPSGDVNNDGAVTAADAQLILTALVELPLPAGSDKTFGDADCDGKLTTLDAQIVLAYVVKLDVAKFCVGTVNVAPASTITIDAGTGKALVGGTVQLTATALDDKNVAISGKVFTWSSSDATKATVDANGLVKGVAIGSVLVTATADGKSTTTAVEIVAASAALTLEVSPLNATVLKTSTIKLVAVVKDAAGNPVTGKTIAFTSQTPAIATVGADGTVTGVELGTAKIDATVDALKTTATVSVVAFSSSANRYWKGGAAAGPTLWSIAENWADGAGKPGLPATTETVKIPVMPNQPVLKEAFVTIAGLTMDPGAKLDIEGNELQVTGDLDGTVIGTGKVTIQGVGQSVSYVRGTLPSVSINGETVVVSPITLTGSLDIVQGALLNLNGYTVSAAKDLTVRGAVLMRAPAEVLDVRGNALFFTDRATLTALSGGTLKIGGNLSIQVPPSVTQNPFPATGTHKLVLDGSTTQTVSLTIVPIGTIQDLEIANKGGGVVFTTATDQNQRYRVSGRTVATTATSISGSGRVNALGSFTTAVGSSVTLRNLAVKGTLAAGSSFKPDTLTLLGPAQDIPVGSPYDYQTVVAAGAQKFTGTTSIAKSLILGCVTTNADCTGSGSADVNGQLVTIAGDLRQTTLGPLSPLVMQKAGAEVTVKGSVMGAVNDSLGTPAFTASGPEWTAGLLRVAGDFLARGAGTVAPAQGAPSPHQVILNGDAQQKLRVATGFTFHALTIGNTLATGTGILMNDAAPPSSRTFVGAVRTALNVTTPVTIAGTARLNVAGDINTANGSKIQLSAIAVGSSLRASGAAGAFTPDTVEFTSSTIVQTIQSLTGYKNILVSGKTVFGGNITLDGSLIVTGSGEADLNGRNVTVNKDLTASGIIRMQTAADTLSVLGEAKFLRTGDAGAEAYVIDGVLKLGGKASGSQAGGFYPSTKHKTIISSLGGVAKSVGGVFNEVEIVTPASTNTTALTLLVARGSLNTSNALSRITFDSLQVNGSATLTGPDTVAQAGKRLAVKGNLVIGRLTIADRAVVDGDLTMSDGAYLRNAVVYKGKYVEAGNVVKPLDGKPTLANLKMIKLTAQPAPATVNVNTPFSPAFTVQLVDSADALLKGTAPVYLDNPDSLSGTVRVITTDGVGTFTNVASKFPALNKAVRVFAYVPTPTTVNQFFPLTNTLKILGPPTKVKFESAGGIILAGSVLKNVDTSPLKVLITDDAGNAVPYTGPVTIDVTGATSPLTGTKTVNVTNATFAVFTDLALTKAGVHVLTVSGTGIASGAAGAVSYTVNPATPTRIAIVTQPGNGVINANVAPFPVVQLLDAYDNVNTSAIPSVTVTFAKVSSTGSPATDPTFQVSSPTPTGSNATWTTFRANLATIPPSKPTWVYTATFKVLTISSAPSANFTITSP